MDDLADNYGLSPRFIRGPRRDVHSSDAARRYGRTTRRLSGMPSSIC